MRTTASNTTTGFPAAECSFRSPAQHANPKPPQQCHGQHRQEQHAAPGFERAAQDEQLAQEGRERDQRLLPRHIQVQGTFGWFLPWRVIPQLQDDVSVAFEDPFPVVVCTVYMQNAYPVKCAVSPLGLVKYPDRASPVDSDYLFNNCKGFSAQKIVGPRNASDPRLIEVPVS